MGKDTKFILGAFIFTLLVVIGLAFLVSSKEKKTGTLSEVKAEGVTVTPLNYELGEVPIKGGIVTKEYEVKNETGGDIELLKIATSCMCTTASAKVGEDETRFFGMEMVGDKNPLLSLKVKNGEAAKISVQFDPAAHGPEGVGPFERVVWLYFDNGMKELTFNGTVIK
ncbi:DUF1573 domain-containing protein [Candidatus Woesebacteria bacterium]|nr:DUF1573 domain-containing protein [Candidatus Woesebacteria bacterium]